VIDRWNDGKIPLLLAHPASAGHGLNLQKGGRTIIWFGLPWSLELYSQFNGRLHRQGQDKPVLVYHILVGDTADEAVHATLTQKDATQQDLLEAIKQLQITRRA
jgi:SNF2 family DNA or RNA helicase